MGSPKAKTHSGYVHWSPIKKEVNIASQSNFVKQKDCLVLKITFILSIKYLSTFFDKHDNYNTAFKYISKSDDNVHTSQDDPNLKKI